MSFSNPNSCIAMNLGQEEDQAGRKMLSPRELSYAIAYALSDRNPDAQLVKAVADGKLNTKEDVRREVARILKDTGSFADLELPK